MNKTTKENVTNIIGLTYLQGTFDKDEINILVTKLNQSGIALRTQETPPKHIMGIEDLFPQIMICISPVMLEAIRTNILSNAIWDGIKYLLFSIRKTIKEKPFVHVQNGKIDTDKKPNIHINIGKSHIVLPADIDDNKFEYFVDKMFESIDKDTIITEKYGFYDENDNVINFYTRHEIAMKLYEDWKESKK